MKIPNLTLAHACRILNIERPDRNVSEDDKADLLAQVRHLYHAALKSEHPDKHGESGGLSRAHNRTVELSAAYQIIKGFLAKRRLTFTEWYGQSSAKRKEQRCGRVVGEASRKAVAQFSRAGIFIQSWPSIIEAARRTGIHQSGISNNANRYRGTKSAGGFVWKFVTLK